MYVDEAHSYKNAFLYTKMRNVAGIAQNEAQKSADMFNKCQYLDEITGGKGITFATGTPISNSMTELYVMQRYLQNSKLQNMGLGLFDSWASTFGEVVTSIELAPEGTGYRAKSRFAQFYNIPELMNMFKEIADIKTSDQLKLPVPEAEYETVVLKPTEQQKEIVESLGERAEVVRNGGVDQIKDDSPGENYAFMNMRFIESHGMQIKKEDYKLVYVGELLGNMSLEDIFERFNIDRPEEFRGHSLSVSDIVVLNDGEKVTAHFVDSISFEQLDSFLNLEEQVLSELAYEVGERYFAIQRTEEGYDYSFSMIWELMKKVPMLIRLLRSMKNIGRILKLRIWDAQWELFIVIRKTVTMMKPNLRSLKGIPYSEI